MAVTEIVVVNTTSTETIVNTTSQQTVIDAVTSPLKVEVLAGEQGVPGPANTLSIGTVTASAPGSSPVATITGAAPTQTLSLTLPRGDTGPVNTLTMGTVTQLYSGQTPTSSITGTAPNQTLTLGLPKGAEILSGAGAPAGATGSQNDWYINTSTWDMSKKTGASTWTTQLNIRGAIGPANTLTVNPVTTLDSTQVPTVVIGGTSPNQNLTFSLPKGAEILSGAGAPAGALGSIGDLYINTTTWDMSRKTASTTWTFVLNIRGATGPAPNLAIGTTTTGAAGSAAAATITGTNPNYSLNLTIPKGDIGAQWYSGTGAPSGALGVVNDYYVVTGGTVGLGDVYRKTGASAWTLQGNIRGAAGMGNVSSTAGAVGNLLTYAAADGSLIQDAGFAASDVVRLTQAQTITGAKTFSANTTIANADAAATYLRIGNSSTGAAGIVFDAINADFAGVDYTLLRQETGPTGNFTVRNYVGNIEFYIGNVGSPTVSINGTGIVGPGSGITALNGSNVSTGTVVQSRISNLITPINATDAYGLTPSGVGYFDANTMTGWPSSFATVLSVNANANRGFQVHVDKTTSKVSIRSADAALGNGWTPFIEVIDNTNAQSIAAQKTFTNASNSFTGSGAGLTALNGSNISTGTVADARLPSRINTVGTNVGAIDANTLSASGWYTLINTTTNTPTAGGYFTLKTIDYSTAGYTTQIASNVNTGILHYRQQTAGTYGSWQQILTSTSGINGSNITTGTVAPARLGSGTASANTFLRGDGAWTNSDRILSSFSGTGLTVGWVRIASQASGKGSATFTVYDDTSNVHNHVTFTASVSYNEDPQITVLNASSYSAASITGIRIVQDKVTAGPVFANPVYLEVQIGTTQLSVHVSNNHGSGPWVLQNPANTALGANYTTFTTVPLDGNPTLTTTGEIHAMNRLRAGITQAVASASSLVTSAAEFELSSNSMVAIGESASGNAHPHITLYRTASGSRSGRGFRMLLDGSPGPVRWQMTGPDVAYGTTGYVDLMTLDISGNFAAVGTVTAGGAGFYGSGTNITGVVHTAGNESVGGSKTFTNDVTVDGILYTRGATGVGDAVRVGNDAWLVDINLPNEFGIQGASNRTVGGIRFGSANTTGIYGDGTTVTITGGLAISSTNTLTARYTQHAETLGSTAGNHVITRQHIHTGATNQYKLTDMMVRRAAGSDWTQADWMQGIAIDSSYGDPTTLRSWIRRDAQNQIIKLGSGTATYVEFNTSQAIFNESIQVNAGAARARIDSSSLDWANAGIATENNIGHPSIAFHRPGVLAYQLRLNNTSGSFEFVDQVGTAYVNMAAQSATLSGNATINGGIINLGSASVNNIIYNNAGVNPPALTTRSTGSKIVLWGNTTASEVDYAIGIENGGIWQSIPSAISGRQFRWYGGTTGIMTLTGLGVLTTGGAQVAASSGTANGFTVTSTPQANVTAIGHINNGSWQGPGIYFGAYTGSTTSWSNVQSGGILYWGENVAAAGTAATKMTLAGGANPTLTVPSGTVASANVTSTATTNSLNLQRFEFTVASAARPTGSKYVEWVGPVEPTNAINGDTWVNTAS